VVALVACQGGSTNPPPVDTGQSPFWSATSTVTLSPPGGPTSAALPGSHGVSGTASFTAAGVPVGGATLTFTFQNFPPSDGTPALTSARVPLALRGTKALPAHTTILYIGVKSDKTITIPSGISFSLVL